jgi:gluconolactonase
MKHIQVYNEKFHTLLGDAPKLDFLLEKDYPFAHEAGIFIPETNEIFITSNRLVGAAGVQRVQISKITFSQEDGIVQSEEISCPSIVMANGGTNYDEQKILICAQGSASAPSGLYFMEVHHPYNAELIVSDFYGRPFNAVNDVVVHSDGSIWFTDPCYGFDQGYKAKPSLPNQVYRYTLTTRSMRAMADGFGRPNGICFSPDEKTVYITDTDWIRGPGNIDDTRASTMFVPRALLLN